MNFRNSYFSGYRFGKPAAKPNLLITAGVHGDEFEPMVAVMRLSKHLQKIPAHGIKGSITLLPVVNKNAFNAASRNGTDGQDVARVCPGKVNGTLTEKVAQQLSIMIREASYYIDLHGGGRVYHIHPLAGYMLHPSKEILEVQRKMAHSFGYPIVWGTTSDLQGRTLSVARDANIPAIYVENGGGSFNKDLIHSYVEGCLNVINTIGFINEQKVKDCRAHYIIEDHGKNSGFLQQMMPAPISGLFISYVKLGETVKKGQVWGIVLDTETGQETSVFADQTGFVFLIRVVPSVKEGDSLGGILAIDQIKNKAL